MKFITLTLLLFITECSCFHWISARRHNSFLTPSLSQSSSLHQLPPLSRLYSSDNLDDLKIDESKLSESEKDRIKFINKLSLEADDFIKNAGFSMNGEQEEDEIEKTIKETQWSGQSNAEEYTASQNNFKDLTSRLGLAFGDTIALTVFALIGRSNHGEGLDIFSVVITAFPFIISWLLLSPFFGAYNRTATSNQASIGSGLFLPWLISIPSALALRGLSKGIVPPIPFMVVSMIATFALLYGWRTVYIKLFGESSDAEYKDAGVFEVFKMVGTLVKRW